MEIKQVNIEELKFADYNPRIITEKQVEDLKSSINQFGVVEPVVVNSNPERFNIIVGGHQRVRIMKILDYKEVPVFYLDLTEEKEKELNVRLNKNTGSWDWSKLANEFDNDELLTWGFTLPELGMSDKSIIDTDNINNSLDSYLESNIKQVVLYFKDEDFKAVIPRLEEVLKEHELKNYSDVVLELLKYYEDNRIKE